MAAPVVWVATELGRSYITSFPWELLGYSQVTVLPIAQLASLFGVRLVDAGRGRERGAGICGCGPRQGPVRYMPAAGAVMIVLAIAVWGSRRAAASEWTRDGEPIRIGMIQGNVDQAQKWDVKRASAIFQDYAEPDAAGHTRRRAARVVARSRRRRFSSKRISRRPAVVRTLAQQAHVPIVFGSDQIERGRPDRFFNSAFLVRADGTTGGVYRKMHLVPFGEYVPFQRLLFFAAPLTEQAGTFSPGLSPELLPVDGHRLSVAICYEVVYPDLVRQFVAGGSELLTTITNDAWFGRHVGAGSAFRSRPRCGRSRTAVISCDRPTPASAASSIPYGRVLAADADLSERRPRRRSALPPDVDLLQRATATCSRMLRRRDAGAVGRRQPPCKHNAHAHRRRIDAPLRGSQQARCGSAELSLKPPAPTKS